jgi:hypothetical protein
MPSSNMLAGMPDFLDERRNASSMFRSSVLCRPRRFPTFLQIGVTLFGIIVTTVSALAQAPALDAGEIDALLASLLDKREEVRGKALKAIVDFGPDFPGAIEGVLEAMEKAEDPFKQRCLAALACLSMDDPKYAAECADLLEENPSWACDFQAAGVLPLGPQTRVMHEKLLPLMTTQGVVIQGILCLQAGVSRSRSGASRRIRFLGISADSADVRRRASESFRVSFDSGGFLAETMEEIDAVALALRWGDNDKCADMPPKSLPENHNALGPVSFIRVTPKPDLARRLRELLKDPHQRVAAWAARCLGLMGDQGKEAIPELKTLVNDSNQEIRLWASFALASLQGDPTETLKGITDALRSPFHAKMRVEACQALSWLGTKARPASPFVVSCIRKPDGGGLISAVETLQEIGGISKETEGYLYWGLLENRNHFFQAECGQALLTLGPDTASVEKFLRSHQDELSAPVREVWEPVLLARAKGAEAGMAARLASFLFEWSTPRSNQANSALLALGPKAAGAIPTLKKILEKKDWRRVEQVANILASIGKDASPLLVESTRSPRWWIRAAAIRALKRMKDLSPEARKALKDAIQEPDEDVRRAAQE